METQTDIFAVQEKHVDDYDFGIEKQYSDLKNDKTIISPTKTEPVYETAVYKIRWLMLTVVVLLNISNGAIWVSFATVTNYTADYFQVTPAKVNWFALIFYVTTIPLMFVALWVTDRFGFKASALTASALNALGSAMRLIATLPGIPDHDRYPIALAGQGVCSLAQPFVIVLHTKISQVWFPEEQRTISTALAAMSNPFGFMVASIVSPIVIQRKEDVPEANYILCGFGIVTGLVGFTVRHAVPPKPPSIAAAKSIESKKVSIQTFIKDVYKIGKNKNFMILTLAIGGGMGMITTLEAMMFQIICPMGYSNKVAGLCCGTMVVGGYIGAGIYSYFTKKRTRMAEIIKFGYTFSVVSSIILTMVFRIRNVAWALALLCAVLGFLSMGIYPICLEAGVETIYPIDESFSAGMIVVSGQIQGAIFMPVMEALAQPLTNEEQHHEACSTESSSKGAYDMTYSGIFLTAYAALLNIIIILFFSLKYKRLATERENHYNNAQINLPSNK